MNLNINALGGVVTEGIAALFGMESPKQREIRELEEDKAQLEAEAKAARQAAAAEEPKKGGFMEFIKSPVGIGLTIATVIGVGWGMTQKRG